jgi:hypothetical protein
VIGARCWLALAAALSMGTILLGCTRDGAATANRVTADATADPNAQPRSFQLGVSALPVEPTEKAYAEAFKLAGELGEVILIQRAPAWADFLPGGSISPRTERLTRLERDLARQHGLKLLLAVDPTVPLDRGQLAGLPENLAGSDFSDREVRAAFIAYTKYLALNYKPAYMAIGVEVDLYYTRRGDAAFRNFLSAYFEAYDAVKEVSPETQVFPTFQYENLLGILARGQARQALWDLVERFQPKLDMLVVSSFPRFAFPSLQDVPNTYYDELATKTNKPVAFISVGWASEEGGLESSATQVAFLYRVITAAERMKSPFVIWFLARDPEPAAKDSLGPLATMGLYDDFGAPKSVLRVWRSYLSRPVSASR